MNTTPTTHSPHPEGYAKLWELIEDIKVAMFTTVAEPEALHSRPMVSVRTSPTVTTLSQMNTTMTC